MTQKIRYSEEVDEAVAGKDVENVKRKGKKKVTADDSDDENVKKKRKSAVESQDIPCESIFETGPKTVPATPNDVDDTKIDCNTNYGIVSKLNDKLSAKQLALFRETCFGHFLNMPPMMVQGALLHNLLMRKVRSLNDDALYFVVSGVKLRLELGELALITGLNCKVGTSITVEQCFNKQCWKSDDDVVKIAILYSINAFLFATLKTKPVDMTYFDLVESGEFYNYPWRIDVFKVKNVFPIEDEILLLDLEGLAFEPVPESSHSHRMSDVFFCTQAPKVDMGQSSCGDDESSNVDMKKELESFRVHVDSKFGEILQAIVDLNKKVHAKHDEKEDAFAYSGGLHTDCADLDMDDNQGIHGDDENVKDVTPNNDVGGGDSSKEVVGGGVGNESQSDVACISMSQSAIDAITQKYHTDKKSENEKGENKSESEIAVITQAAKVSVASTEVVGDEQSIKDDCPKNTTINAVVTEEARGDVLPQGGDVESADAGNESVDSELTKGRAVLYLYFCRESIHVYTDDDDHLASNFNFGVSSISSKMWFHTLNYAGRPLSIDNLNAIFYYLRKKEKYGSMPIRVTTTYFYFDNTILKLFTKFMAGGAVNYLIDKSTDIMEYMYGFCMLCNTPWTDVDYVLFYMHLGTKWHWILGCLSIHERNDILLENGLHRDHRLSDPLDVNMVETLPKQSNTDCGVFIACFTEYLIENIEIFIANFDIDGL
ncbi:hypothetical protein RND71_022050 [Anisodus tanguticus]|uniref:Ubiquitin-like protease family profile domain-containing protein n=1 Tax=Anisodus tanguticus TaxID=243964 RepID=A0AAE1RXS1_9SOLA|nr:hypothetical protein RND71_022050 [Anisodus tanguticus]